MSRTYRSPGTSSAMARIVSSEFTQAPAHGSMRQPGAPRNIATVSSHFPGPSRNAGVKVRPGAAFGSAISQLTGKARVEGSVPTGGSINSKFSSRARTEASAGGRGASVTPTTPSG